MNHLGSLKLLQNVEDGDDFIKRLAQTNIPTTQILNAPDTTNYSSFDNFLDSTSSYILYLKNSSLVNQTVDFLERMADWNMHATYLVILQDKCDPEQANRDIITALRFHTIATALADGDGVLRFYVYSPYAEENSCGQKQVATEVGSCMRRMTEMPKGVLPRDLKGCTFTVGWFGRSTPQARPTLRMFSAFGETFNLSIRYLLPCLNLKTSVTDTRKCYRFVKDDRHHQEYFTNGSLARGLNELSTGKLDLLGMFAVESRFYNTFRVVPTGRFECIYWLLPERRPISLFTLLITENLLVVLLLLALLIATTLTWRVVAHSKTLSDAFVSVARISMSYSLPSVPNNRTLKMFLMFCFAAFLPLDVSIQSFLTSTLTHPIFEPKISTDEELIRSDMPMKYQTYYLSVANMWQKELTAEMRARAIEKHVDMYKYDPEDFTGSKYMAVLIYSYMMLEPVKNQEDFEIIDTVSTWPVLVLGDIPSPATGRPDINNHHHPSFTLVRQDLR